MIIKLYETVKSIASTVCDRKLAYWRGTISKWSDDTMIIGHAIATRQCCLSFHAVFIIAFYYVYKLWVCKVWKFNSDRCIIIRLKQTQDFFSFGHQAVSTMRPRSGREYQKMDRNFLDENVKVGYVITFEHYFFK